MKLSALILTNNQPERLERCLRALAAAWAHFTAPQNVPAGGTPELEVLVLDMGDSKAATQKAMRASGAKELFWVPCEQWWNRPRAIAYAMKRVVTGDTLLFLSDDCRLSEFFFTGLCLPWSIDPQQNTAAADIVSPLLMLDETHILAAGIGLTKNMAPSFRAHMLDSASYRPELIQTMPFGVPFYCALMRRETYDKVDGFDFEFQGGLEDVDFCLRARELGLRTELWNNVACVCEGDSTNDLVPRTGSRAIAFVLAFSPFARRWLLGDSPRIDALTGAGGVAKRLEEALGGGVVDDGGARSSDAA